MVRKKSIRAKGKINLGKFFQKIDEGESVAVVGEPSLNPRFPARLRGCTGIVEGKRGSSYVVKINDKNKEKTFLIAPIHLKKIKKLK